MYSLHVSQCVVVHVCTCDVVMVMMYVCMYSLHVSQCVVVHVCTCDVVMVMMYVCTPYMCHSVW